MSSPEEMLNEVEREEDVQGAETVQRLAQEIPAAREPLTAVNLQLATAALADVVALLSGGEAPPPPMPEVGPDGAEQVSPPFWAAVTAVEKFLEQSGAPPELLFSAADLVTTNEGLSELAERLKAIAAQPALKQLKPKPKATAPPPPQKPGGRAAGVPTAAEESSESPPKGAKKVGKKPGERAANL